MVLPFRSRTLRDAAAHHDAVAAVGPVDLLEDARRGAGVLHQLRGEQDHHVQGAPEDVALAGGVGVARGHRVVDQLQVDLEAVLLEEDALVIGGEAVVGRDDGQPADPDVDGELHDLFAGVPLVGRSALDRRAASAAGTYLYSVTVVMPVGSWASTASSGTCSCPRCGPGFLGLGEEGVAEEIRAAARQARMKRIRRPACPARWVRLLDFPIMSVLPNIVYSVATLLAVLADPVPCTGGAARGFGGNCAGGGVAKP